MKVVQIKAGRVLAGLTQEELAKVSGVALPTIKRIESTGPDYSGSPDTLKKLTSAILARGVELVESDGQSEHGAGVRFTHIDPSGSLRRCAQDIKEGMEFMRSALLHAPQGGVEIRIRHALEVTVAAHVEAQEALKNIEE